MRELSHVWRGVDIGAQDRAIAHNDVLVGR